MQLRSHFLGLFSRRSTADYYGCRQLPSTYVHYQGGGNNNKFRH
jgi:hypothetical protein